MWSTARSEAALEAALPVPIQIRPMRGARRLRLRFDEASGTLRLTCPRRTSRREALAWALDQRDWIEAQLARLQPAEPFATGAMIPLEGRGCSDRLARGLSRARRACDGELRAAARSRASAAHRSLPQAARAATSCRVTLPNIPQAAGGDGRARSRRRCRDTLGQLLVAGPDPLELAADPRAARRPPLRRRARGRALRASRPRPRFKALEARLFGPGLAAAKAALRRIGPRLRRIGRGDYRLRLTRRMLGLARRIWRRPAAAAAAAAGMPGRAPAASGSRCRRAGPSAASADSSGLRRRRSNRHSVFVDHRRRCHWRRSPGRRRLPLPASAASRATGPGSRTARPADWRPPRS